MVWLTINGARHEVADGTLLIDAIASSGAAVPHLCHDKRIKPSAGCRLCVVEVEGEQRPIPSCACVVSDGMTVRTDSKELEQLRRTNLGLIAEHYPSAPCGAAQQLPFQCLLAKYGIQLGNVSQEGLFEDSTHPYIGVAMDRCISCERCIRICEQVQGQFVWEAWGRGGGTKIVTGKGPTLLTGGCVSCGACVDSCPSGALFDKRVSAEPTTWTRTTCVYCGVGCQMDVGTAEDRVIAVRPAESPVNRGHLCVKGRYAFEFNHAADRILKPMIRHGGAWRTTTWDEALDFAVASLKEVAARDGPDSVGVLGSARATNEENYLAQKFARVILGTNNVDCCARVCHTPSAKALKLMLGAGAATNNFDDIEHTNGFLICGANPTENHPIVGARIKQAVLRGAHLVVIDPRRTELARLADVHLAVRPGHNIPLFHAIAATLIEEGLVDQDFIAARVTGFEAFALHVSRYKPEMVAKTCGVSAASIRAAARLYAQGQPTMCFHGLGVTEHLQGTEGVMALINLALLTGNIGRSGAGINPLRGQNNVQGAAQMGCDPISLPGGQTFEAAGARFEQVWGVKLPPSRGLNLLTMMDAARAGRLKGLWAIGYDIYHSLADANHTATSLSALDVVIVQDLFLNKTAEAYGTVFLPTASFFEKDGTFMNSDRRVQRIRAALPVPGDARPDWWIIQELAARFGTRHGFEFADPQMIWDEVRSLWPDGAGVTYSRLECESLHWPCPDETHPGTAVLHRDRFIGGKTAMLSAIDYISTPEQPDEDYPLLLTTGRALDQFNSGTMSLRTPNTELRRTDTLDMSPADAANYAMVEGETVRVASRYGKAVLPVHISPSMQEGQLFCTFHCPDLFVNLLTSPVRDRLVHAPEYKVVMVRLEKNLN